MPPPHPTPTLEEATRQLTMRGQMFETEDSVIAGRPVRVWKNAPPSLRTVLEMSRAHGDQDFLVYDDERLSFAEHFRRAAHLASELVERYGLEKGERVAIAMRNLPEWALTFWAATTAGAVVVPLNAWWKGEELEYGLADSGASILFADAERMERLRGHLDGLDLRARVVARPAAEPDAGWEPFAAVAGHLPDAPELPAVAIGPEDDATIFYTSGTTGKPKGALGTHRNICTNLMSIAFIATRQGLRRPVVSDPLRPPGDGDGGGAQNAYLLSVPLFHATGCHSVLVPNAAFGGKVVMMRKWDAERALELIERERITIFGGVPAMAWQVLESPEFENRDTSSVRSVSYGGAPAAPELVRRIKEAFPDVSPGNGYGLTETSSVTTLLTGDDYVRKPHSVGPPVPVCEVKVVDQHGEELPTGEVGELWIRGPNIVKGYWNNPEATAEAITDGWLHTGDIARIDDEGYISIVDRAKDMVIRGGENVYSVEVESVLYDHPAVIDAAVFGIPHRVLGEEVAAAVQVKAGSSVTEAELREYCSERLAAFKVPVRMDVRDEPLPRNPQGKIQKRELRDEAASRWA